MFSDVIVSRVLSTQIDFSGIPSPHFHWWVLVTIYYSGNTSVKRRERKNAENIIVDITGIINDVKSSHPANGYKVCFLNVNNMF